MTTVNLYNFTKRQNSTKQPTGDGVAVSLNLKQDTSLYSPVFTFSQNVTSYNYLKWQNRFYYIDEINYIPANRVYEVTCTLDHLATYKSDILNTSAFVLFSTSDYDPDIPDTRLSTNKEASISVNSSASLGSGNYYAITHAGNDGYPLVGMSWSNMHALTQKLYDDGFVNDFLFGQNPLEYVGKMFNNVSDCISSIVELPYEPAHPVAGTTVHLAKFNTGITGNVLGGLDDVRSVSVNIPWQFSDFRNRSQYTSLLIYLPGYGLADLNADDYIGKSAVSIKYTMNPADGTIEYLIDNRVKYTASCGIKVPYGFSSAGSLQSMAGGAVASIGAMAVGNVAGAVASGFNTVLSNMQRSSGSVGGSGVGFKNKSTISVITISHDTNVAPSSMATVYGRPLNAVRSLATLTGYVQTSDMSVITNAPVHIKQAINEDLNGGVYLE